MPLAPSYCFQRANDPTSSEDDLYCIGTCLILGAAVINLGLLSMLFLWHSSSSKEANAVPTWQDTKTAVLLMMISVQVVLIIDYLLVTNMGTHNLLVFFSFALVSVNFVVICYSQTIKLALMLDEYASIVLRLRIIAGAALVAIIALMIVEYNNSATLLCTTWYFVLISAVNLAVLGLCLLQAKQIDGFFAEIKDRQMQLLKYDDSGQRQDTMVKIEKRALGMKELYRIVITLVLVNAINLGYGFFVYILTDKPTTTCSVFNSEVLANIL
jgi:hypothetical protein